MTIYVPGDVGAEMSQFECILSCFQGAKLGLARFPKYGLQEASGLRKKTIPKPENPKKQPPGRKP